MLGAMVDPTSQAEPDAAVAAASNASTAQDDTRSGDVDEEVAPAPTPFDHPLFLPAVCIGFTVWFGYDTYIQPMDEHLDFNFYGFKIVLAAATGYGYLAWCEMTRRASMPWVLPTIFAVLAAWMAAEAFGVPGFELPEQIEYPAISLWGFYLSAALVPVSALREWLRARRIAARAANAKLA